MKSTIKLLKPASIGINPMKQALPLKPSQEWGHPAFQNGKKRSPSTQLGRLMEQAIFMTE
ncbi:hypothetical protein [Paenibacillus alba]|uniref:Uncharacterized protein n=1 Tax=Paenibacillus alba TaxID=1197127 RepID=A0ABU6GC27_9BACL|nr:hypothetical protein [Paenibacillus alba]MEC0231743.1 hypothetical protein [Paenibacillus alba]